MPKRKFSRKKVGFRRRFRRKRRVVGSRWKQRKVARGQRVGTTIIRQPSGLPDRLFVKLRLHVDLLFANTSGGYSSFQVATNSAFDPMQASGTQQGYLFDQWATLYGRYRVHGFYYRLEPNFGALGITSTSVKECTCVPSLQSTAFSSARQAAEQPRARTFRWQVNAGRAPTLKGFFRMHPIAGITKKQYKDDPQFQALVSADPSTMIYFHIGTSDPVTTDNTQTTCGARFTQYVEFYQRAIPSVS